MTVLDAYEHNAWRCDRFRWETSVCPLFYFTKDQDPDMPIKAVYERIFERAGRPSDEIDENPPLKAMLDSVAVTPRWICSSNRRITSYSSRPRFCKKSGAIKPRFQRNKEEYGATHQLVRQFVQGRLLANQISTRRSCWPRLVPLMKGSIKVELRECDKRLLKVVGQSGQEFPFPDVPNLRWNRGSACFQTEPSGDMRGGASAHVLFHQTDLLSKFMREFHRSTGSPVDTAFQNSSSVSTERTASPSIHFLRIMVFLPYFPGSLIKEATIILGDGDRSSEQVIRHRSDLDLGTLSLLGRRLNGFPAGSSISARKNHE